MEKFLRVADVDDDINYINLKYIVDIYGKISKDGTHSTYIKTIDDFTIKVEENVDEVYKQIQEALKDSRAILG